MPSQSTSGELMPPVSVAEQNDLAAVRACPSPCPQHQWVRVTVKKDRIWIEAIQRICDLHTTERTPIERAHLIRAG
jgi:hypothetical protein